MAGLVSLRNFHRAESLSDTGAVGTPIVVTVTSHTFSVEDEVLNIGVNGNIVMAHGRSDATDIKNAIGLAARMVREGWWQPPKTRNPIAAAAHLNMQETEIR
ncbi:MAG: hypothetical protein IIB12_02055 [Chloroflexi bacterium]|nr:hypothetical protein [Chloroflexota bacterium]